MKELIFTAPYLGMKLDYIVEYNYSSKEIVGGSHDYDQEILIDHDVDIISITYITQQGKELDYTDDSFLQQEAREAIIAEESE